MNRKLVAELAGTYGLVLCGTGAIAVDESTGGALGTAGIAVVFGLTVLLMILAFAPISGAHINPAVTLALAIGGKARRSSVLPYLGAQVVGALLASLTVKALCPASELLGATVPSGEPLASFALEVLLTFLLMLVILASSRSTRTAQAIIIGGTVGLEAFFAGPISGASMNPARSIAPQVVSGDLTWFWLYTPAPVLGGIAAMLLWLVFQRKRIRPSTHTQ